MRIQPLATEIKNHRGRRHILFQAYRPSYCRHSLIELARPRFARVRPSCLQRRLSLMCRACSHFGKFRPLSRHTGKSGEKPDVLLCDGQGIAHPRKLGFAAHLGLCLGIPTVGCAKSRLCGDHDSLTLRKGSSKPLLAQRGAGRARLLLQRRRKADLYLSRPPLGHCLLREAHLALPSTLPDTRTIKARPPRSKQTEGGSRKPDI